MLSAYSLLAANFIVKLNQYFLEYFQLPSEYQYEGISDGDRYGVITVRGFESNRAKASGVGVRGGFQFLLFKFDIIFTAGAKNRISAEGLALETMLDLHHGIPSIKQFLEEDELISDFQTAETFNCNKRQATKPPHNWIVDISCQATADITIFVDTNGQHQMR